MVEIIKLDYHSLHAQYHCTIPLTPGKELNRIRFVKHWNEIHLSPQDTPEDLGQNEAHYVYEIIL